MTLVAYELRRIVGRKGSFYGVMAVILAIAILVAALAGDDNTEGLWQEVIATTLVFGASVIGALAGSYDTSQGTMRYLVLTGVPRWKLVTIRVPALVAAITLVALPAMIVGGVAMAGGPDDGAAIVRALAGGLTEGVTWGIVALAIGTLLRSNGAGIAVALVLYLLSSTISVVVRLKVSETVGDYLLPNVAAVVARFGHVPDDIDGPDPSTMGFAPALIALLIWLVVIVGLAVARAERDEY